MIETYIPLYRKYRPQAFDALMGQSALAKALGNAIEQGRVAHAYLFTGPRGTGKTSTARILAKSLNCEQGPTLTPCQVCASCQSITAGNALDVIEFDAASNNGVDQARELVESVRLAPLAGRYKIYIIDEVHMLTPAAFNALLKTLEEPPPNVIFIFATTEAHKVLPTIVSRCQRFDFQRIDAQAMLVRLRWVCEQEALEAEEDALALIARCAKGGLRDALGLLDQVSVLVRAKDDPVLQRDDVLQFVGALDEARLMELTQAIAQQDVPGLLTLLADWSQGGVEPVRVTAALLEHVRHLMVVKACQEKGLAVEARVLDVGERYAQELQRQATEAFTLEELPQLLHQLTLLESDLKRTNDPQLVLEVGLLSLAYRDRLVRLAQLQDRLNALEQQLAQGTAAAGRMMATPPPVSPPPLPPAPAGFPPPLRPAPFPDPLPSESSFPEPPSVQSSMPPAFPAELAAMPSAAAPPLPAEATAAVQGPAFSPAHHHPAETAMALPALHAAIVGKIASPAVKALMQQQSWLEEVTDTRLVFGSTEANTKTMQQPNKLIHVQKAVEAYFGGPREVRIQPGKKPEGLVAPALVSPVASVSPLPSAASGAQVSSATEPPTLGSSPATPATPNSPPSTGLGLNALVPAPFDPAGETVSFNPPALPPPLPIPPVTQPPQAVPLSLVDTEQPPWPEEDDAPPADGPPAEREPAAEDDWQESRDFALRLLRGKVLSSTASAPPPS